MQLFSFEVCCFYNIMFLVSSTANFNWKIRNDLADILLYCAKIEDYRDNSDNALIWDKAPHCTKAIKVL